MSISEDAEDSDRRDLSDLCSRRGRRTARLLAQGWIDVFVGLKLEMPAPLTPVLTALREHESELRDLGVCHAAVFGSVARGEARPDSDVDVLIELDPLMPLGLFEYSRLKLYFAGLLGDDSDVVNRNPLKPLLKDSTTRDAVKAF